MSSTSSSFDINTNQHQQENDLNLAGRVIIVTGAPASGKGTQCKKLAAKFGLVHVSTGDLFREHVERGTDLGVQAKQYLDNRCFVPDELVVSLVRDKLRECLIPDAEGGFPRGRGALLDGFPRTSGQAEWLVRLLGGETSIDRVLFLEANDKALVARAPGRRIHKETGEIFHTRFAPPPETAVADNLLVKRQGDDDARSFQTRLDVFRGHIRRILPYFSGKVQRVSALQSPDEVHKSILRALATPTDASVTAASSAASNSSDTSGAPECAICFSEEANYLCAPCGHQCGCQTCLETVKAASGVCPICRTRVQSLQRVYVVGSGRNGSTSSKQVVPTVATDSAWSFWAPLPPQVRINDNDDVTVQAQPDLDEALDHQVAAAEENDWPDDLPADEDVVVLDEYGNVDIAEDSTNTGRHNVTLEIAPCTDIDAHAAADDVTNVAVSIRVPERLSLQDNEVVGTDVVCVVDVSGSMGSLWVETDGKTNKDGLSILDIVKHSVKTVMHSLGPQDRLSLVAFSTTAATLYPLKPMTEWNRKEALEWLDLMHPQNTTNIWAGLLEGMEALRAPWEEDNSAVILVDKQTANDTDDLTLTSTAKGRSAKDIERKISDTTDASTTSGTSGSSKSSPSNVLSSHDGGSRSFTPGSRRSNKQNKKRQDQTASSTNAGPISNAINSVKNALGMGASSTSGSNSTDGTEPEKVEKTVTVVARRKSLLLLTDGMPNVNPPRGHLAELRDYKDKYPDFAFQVNTFGFGYQLQSDLLLALAQECGGSFAFIPDAVIVGTTFVNSVANALSTFTQAATLSLCPCGGAKFWGGVLGYNPSMAGAGAGVGAASTRNNSNSTAVLEESSEAVTEESWGRAVTLGPLQLGQAREIVVPMKKFPAGSKPYLEAVLTFSNPTRFVPGDGGRVPVQERVAEKCSARSATVDAAVGGLRSKVVLTGWAALQLASSQRGKVAVDAMKMLQSQLATETLADDADGRLVALRADVDGRMSKALQGQDRFNRWGKHYLRALTRAHQLQLCTNFMDPGLQVYGSEEFRKYRDIGDKVFLALPPPQRSLPASNNVNTRGSTMSGVNSGRSSAGTAAPQAPAPVNMSTYYGGAGGGCYGGESVVTRQRIVSLSVLDEGDGEAQQRSIDETVQVKDVRPGDMIRKQNGCFAEVRCVVRIARRAGKSLVVFPSGLSITPRHPVYLQAAGEWFLPRDLVGAELTIGGETGVTAIEEVQSEDHIVYNLVLRDSAENHTPVVGGLGVASWGHGLQGAVIGHEFFGTQLVLSALEAHAPQAYNQGGFIDIGFGGVPAIARAAATRCLERESPALVFSPPQRSAAGEKSSELVFRSSWRVWC